MATTEQQAVTRDDALTFADEAFRNRDITFSHCDVVDMTAALGSFLSRHRLASVSSASAETPERKETLSERQAREVMNPGFGSAVGRSDGTAWNAAASNLQKAQVAPEPVPATNQAGEVANLRQALRNIAEGNLGDAPWQANYARIKEVATTALATQPATSQEGESVRRDDIRRSIIRQLGDDPYADRIILNGTDWDIVLEALRTSTTATPTPPTLSEDLREAERLREDLAFLLARSGQAGKFTFGGKRWTGVSSNALVSIAFGEAEEALPSDSSDLAACYRAVMRLPTHRRADAVFDHLEAGERYVESKYPGSIEWAREDAEWPGRAPLAQVKAS